MLQRGLAMTSGGAVRDLALPGGAGIATAADKTRFPNLSSMLTRESEALSVDFPPIDQRLLLVVFLLTFLL